MAPRLQTDLDDDSEEHHGEFEAHLSGILVGKDDVSHQLVDQVEDAKQQERKRTEMVQQDLNGRH